MQFYYNVQRRARCVAGDNGWNVPEAIIKFVIKPIYIYASTGWKGFALEYTLNAHKLMRSELIQSTAYSH